MKDKTYDDKVEAVAEILWQYYRKNRGRWHMENSMVQDVYRTKAHTLLELALGDVRELVKLELESYRGTQSAKKYVHDSWFMKLLTLCPPAPPVKIEWNEASERGFDTKIKRELVKNVLNNEEDVTKATDQIMQIFAEVSDAPKI